MVVGRIRRKKKEDRERRKQKEEKINIKYILLKVVGTQFGSLPSKELCERYLRWWEGELEGF